MNTFRSALGLTVALMLTAGAALAQQPAAKDTTHKVAATSAPQVPDSLLAQAKVKEDSARTLAVHHVRGGTVQSLGLGRVRGKLIWTFEMKVRGKRGLTRVRVDATDGKIVS